MNIATLAIAMMQAIVFSTPADDAAPPKGPRALGAAKSFHITRWSLDDGLPQSTITAIAQGADGYLWLGTFGGLVRFDGIRFNTYTMENAPGLTTNRIVSLCVSRDGTLWIGTETGGLLRRVEGGFEKVVDVHQTGIIWQIVEAGNGDLWLRCNDIGRLHDGQWEVVDPTSMHESSTISTIHVDESGRLWLGRPDGVLRESDSGFDFIPIAPLDGGRLKIVTNHPDRVWLIAGNGVAYLDKNDKCHLVVNEGTAHPACGIVDAQGDLLFPHKRGDLGVVRGDEVLSSISVDSGLEPIGKRIGIRDLYESQDGIVWAGTNIGLLRLSTEPFVRLGKALNLEIGARHVFRDGGNGVFIEAGSAKQILHWDGGQLNRFDTGPLKVLNFWGVIGGTRQGALIADRDGTWRMSSSRLQRLDDIGPAHGAIEAPDGTLWLLCPGKLTWMRGTQSGAVDIPERAACPRPSSLFSQTNDGAIWFADGSHLVRFDPQLSDQPFETFSLNREGPQSDIRCIHRDGAGALWISTYGEGLFRLRDGAFVQIATAEGLPDTNLGGILEDDDHRLWINSNRGVIVVPLSSLNAVVDGTQPRISCRVLSTGEVNGSTACRTPDGQMWFPTIDDLILADPATYRSNDIPPRVVIENVETDGMPAEMTGGQHVGISGANIQFAYTAFSFAHPDQLRFRYRLENYDADWHDVGNRRIAYYTRVPPGEYRFRVIAANEDGVWSEAGATLPIRVVPHFYETTIFRIGAVLSVIGLLLAAHRQRLSIHRRHAHALAAEIQQRKESEIENRRLEKLLRESTKLEAVGRLAGGIAHDFNNVLAAIFGSTEVLRHELAREFADDDHALLRESLDCITASSQRAAALTKQLLAYSRRQLLRPTVIDANDVIMKMRPMLRQLLPSGIDLTMTLTGDVASARVDVTQLEQVVMNLVLNARDAIRDSGTIRITTELTTSATPSDAAPDRGDDTPYVMIAISDTGEGISDEALPHIFEPFYTTRFDQGGTGLGLATVQGVVYQSGGHIVVNNKGDAGTTFAIYLPHADIASAETHAAALDDVRGGDETILLCEDDEAVRRIARRALERAGYTVLDAALPSKARELATSHRQIDLLITDIVMPGEDGFALAEFFRTAHPQARALFISGYANVTFDMPEMTRGHARFVGKPFLAATLLREVRRVLDDD